MTKWICWIIVNHLSSTSFLWKYFHVAPKLPVLHPQKVFLSLNLRRLVQRTGLWCQSVSGVLLNHCCSWRFYSHTWVCQMRSRNRKYLNTCPDLSVEPSPRVTKAPSIFSATLWRLDSSVDWMSLAAFPIWTKFLLPLNMITMLPESELILEPDQASTLLLHLLSETWWSRRPLKNQAADTRSWHRE